MTRVLITGGTGDLGSYLLPHLTSTGDTVRIMSRGPRKAGYDASIEWAQANIETGHGLAEAVAGVDVIAHLASNPIKPQQVDVQGTENLLSSLTLPLPLVGLQEDLALCPRDQAGVRGEDLRTGEQGEGRNPVAGGDE